MKFVLLGAVVLSLTGLTFCDYRITAPSTININVNQPTTTTTTVPPTTPNPPDPREP